MNARIISGMLLCLEEKAKINEKTKPQEVTVVWLVTT